MFVIDFPRSDRFSFSFSIGGYKYLYLVHVNIDQKPQSIFNHFISNFEINFRITRKDIKFTVPCYIQFVKTF